MTDPATTARPRYLRTAETAKLVRAALKPAFPDTRFSVRSSTYSGGSSIRVEWTDGPTTRQVDAVVGVYAGAAFDGMIDLKTHKTTWLCPVHGARIAERYGHSYASENGPVDSRCCARSEIVHMGADYVMTHRDLSPAVRAAFEARTARMIGQPDYDGDRWVDGRWMSHWFHQMTHDLAVAADPATGDPVVTVTDRPRVRPVSA